ncbi:divalent-cation tolerance protein CutA [Nonomuraea dietziae]|uniref:divalent-cation tolerance protein CutA n=1 Tax=Nonomuraea dietziae TaxID=65515 RepID=UPI00341F96A5
MSPTRRSILVIVTTRTADEATHLADSIVTARLAAGAQISGPIRSIYWWQGAKQDEEEWKLTIITTTDLLQPLEAHIKANHAYITPQIIATEISAGSADYLEWISAETMRTDASS